MKTHAVVSVVEGLLSNMKCGEAFHARKVYDAVMAHPIVKGPQVMDRVFGAVMSHLRAQCENLGGGYFAISGVRASKAPRSRG